MKWSESLAPIRPQEEAKKERQRRMKQFQKDCAPLMKELGEVGFVYDTIDGLIHSGVAYRAAVPVLLKWVSMTGNYDVREAIVRALSVPWAKPDAAPVFIKEFRTADSSEHSYKWALGNGLSIVADDSVVDELIELARDRTHGKSREMLALALANIRDPRVVDVLLELLQDEQMAGHAVIALGKLGASKGRASIEPFVHHEKAWIRREAKKALSRIDREAAKGTNRLASKRIQ